MSHEKYFIGIMFCNICLKVIMRLALFLIAAATFVCVTINAFFSPEVAAQTAASVNGAGSTAAAPVLNRWGEEYAKRHTTQLRYDRTGSGAGLRSLREGKIAFAASDVPLATDELEKRGWVMAPMFMSAAVPIVNLPRVGSTPLRLSGETLAAIFRGELTRWNAPALRALNPELNLPDLAIKPVVRAAGSGTTHYFTNYLAAVDSNWRGTVGVGDTVKWSSTFTVVNSAADVAKTVRADSGAIGYIDLQTAQDEKVSIVHLRNNFGTFVQPTAMSVRQAVESSAWMTKGDFQTAIVNASGAGAWPIPMASFVYMPRIAADTTATSHTLKFLVWALLAGDRSLEGTGFVRLSDRMQALVFRSLSAVTDKEGRKLGFDALAAKTS
jgi:phosphate transport system substrate-binding protein